MKEYFITNLQVFIYLFWFFSFFKKEEGQLVNFQNLRGNSAVYRTCSSNISQFSETTPFKFSHFENCLPEREYHAPTNRTQSPNLKSLWIAIDFEGPLGSSMEAIRKQATRLREQVARQQQVRSISSLYIFKHFDTVIRKCFRFFFMYV